MSDPRLAVLLVVSAAGLAAGRWRRLPPRGGELGLAWAVVGLAATLLLLPALRLPGGIPSPAGELSQHAPWQGSVAPSGSQAGLSDVTYQIQPWLLFLRHELRAGRLPLWNPFQLSGTPFWGNGQGAPLFPLHLLFAALPLHAGFVLLPWLRLVIAGLGGFLLARELGVSQTGALFSGVTFCLSGMPVSFVLYPMGNALALVPWVLWTCERLARGRRGATALLALAAGLQLLAGHPETALHTALLSALYLAVRGAGEGVGRVVLAARWAAGWLLAAGLAAVELLPFAATLAESSRWHWHPATGFPPAAVLLAHTLRTVLPDLFGRPSGGGFGPFPYVSSAVYAGSLAIPLAAAGLAAVRRPPAAGGGWDRRWLAVAAVLVFSAAAAWQLAGLREALAAVPLLGRALHHRLLFGVELGLALLAGAGLDRWREGPGRDPAARRGLLAGGALALVLLAAAWWIFAEPWAVHGLSGHQLRWTGWAVLCILGLVLATRWRPALRRRIAAVLVVVAAGDLLAAHLPINPALPLADLYPATGAVDFLAGRPGRLAGSGDTLRPNAATVYRLRDVRGDDPVKLARYAAAMRRRLGAGHPTYFVPIGRWDRGWLDRLAVRWVIGGPADLPPEPDLELVYRGADARVWRRPGALPWARWAGAATGCRVRVGEREPARAVLDWSCPRPGLLVVAESWDAGWRARRGELELPVELPVERVAGTLLGVRLGPGSGRLELVYRPPGLIAGAVLSALSALLLAGLAVAGRRPLLRFGASETR